MKEQDTHTGASVGGLGKVCEVVKMRLLPTTHCLLLCLGFCTIQLVYTLYTQQLNENPTANTEKEKKNAKKSIRENYIFKTFSEIQRRKLKR